MTCKKQIWIILHHTQNDQTSDFYRCVTDLSLKKDFNEECVSRVGLSVLCLLSFLSRGFIMCLCLNYPVWSYVIFVFPVLLCSSCSLYVSFSFTSCPCLSLQPLLPLISFIHQCLLTFCLFSLSVSLVSCQFTLFSQCSLWTFWLWFNKYLTLIWSLLNKKCSSLVSGLGLTAACWETLR